MSSTVDTQLHTIGLISDTHGLIRPEALAALRGVELILHAGDIGSTAVLDALRAIAPTIAVRGNNDRDAWADSIPLMAQATVAQRNIYIIHERAHLRKIELEDIALVVFGHSHKPEAQQEQGVWFINPGSAGPRRFKLPVTLVRLSISASSIIPQFVELVSGSN